MIPFAGMSPRGSRKSAGHDNTGPLNLRLAKTASASVRKALFCKTGKSNAYRCPDTGSNSAESPSHYSSFCKTISNANSGAKSYSVFSPQVFWVAAIPAITRLFVVGSYWRSALAPRGERRVEFPAQSEVQGQLPADLPTVRGVSEDSVPRRPCIDRYMRPMELGSSSKSSRRHSPDYWRLAERGRVVFGGFRLVTLVLKRSTPRGSGPATVPDRPEAMKVDSP